MNRDSSSLSLFAVMGQDELPFRSNFDEEVEGFNAAPSDDARETKVFVRHVVEEVAGDLLLWFGSNPD